MKKICIIGAGLCGGYLANELSKYDNFIINIVDIDSINNDFNKKKKLKNIYSNNHLNIKFIDEIIRGYGFGGTSNYWHGGLTEFDELELTKIDKFLDTNFSHSLKKYYNKVWHSLKKDNFTTEKYRFDSINKLFTNSLNFSFKEIFLQKKPYKSRPLLHNLIKNKKIYFFENSVCLNINTNKENKVKSITISNEGSVKDIESDIFILSAGAFETPRILLQSIEKGSLDLENSNIGLNLIDHPFLKIGEIEKEKKSKKNFEYFNKSISKNFTFRSAFSFIEEINNDKLNHSIVLRPHINDSLVTFKLKLEKNIKNKNFIQIFSLIFKNLLRLDLIYYFLISSFNKNIINSKKIDVYLHLDQVSSIKNKVILTNQFDEFKRSIPNIIYGFDQNEINTIKKVYSLLNIQLSNTNFIFKINKRNIFNFYHGNHYSGTARISNNAKSGVVDQNLKVHNMSNLYICDSSVIPFFGSSNPVLTLMALSKKLADKLQR